MNNITDKQLHEQDTDNLGYELGMQMSSLGPIPKTKKQAAEVIKRIFNSSKQPFYGVGENISLDSDLNKIKDKVRFFEYGKSFHSEKEGRGFNFEGMLAGLFNGTPAVEVLDSDGNPVAPTAEHRKIQLHRAGIPPSPVIMFREEIGEDDEGNPITTGVTANPCAGTQCIDPPNAFSMVETYWKD